MPSEKNLARSTACWKKTAEHYEREVDSTVARLSTLLEPFIMVVLGVLIGGLVMALYLPIFQLGQVV